MAPLRPVAQAATLPSGPPGASRLSWKLSLPLLSGQSFESGIFSGMFLLPLGGIYIIILKSPSGVFLIK